MFWTTLFVIWRFRAKAFAKIAPPWVTSPPGWPVGPPPITSMLPGKPCWLPPRRSKPSIEGAVLAAYAVGKAFLPVLGRKIEMTAPS